MKQILIALCLLITSFSSSAVALKIEQNVLSLREERDRLRAQLAQQQAEADRLRSQLTTRSLPTALRPPSQDPSQQEKIARLEAAIAEGQAAGSELRSQISGLEAEAKKLEVERQKLLNIQTALTSGLIGAIVTAIVALAGVFSNFRRSRVDRDLRRLELMEKAQVLASKGLIIPKDIVTLYLGGKIPLVLSASAGSSEA